MKVDNVVVILSQGLGSALVLALPNTEAVRTGSEHSKNNSFWFRSFLSCFMLLERLPFYNSHDESRSELSSVLLKVVFTQLARGMEC